MIFSPWENVAVICVHKPMAVVVQDPLPTWQYIVEEGVGLGIGGGGGEILDSGWITKFLLQNTSSPGSTEMKAGMVLLFPTWSDSWCNLKDQKWHYYPITLL